TSLSLMLVPAFAGAGQGPEMMRRVWTTLGLFVAGGFVYALLIGLFREPLISLLYGGRYDQLVTLAWWAGLMAVPAGCNPVAGAALRAWRRPAGVLAGIVVWTLVVCAFGFPAPLLWGVSGAIVGMLAGTASLSVTLVWQLRRRGL